jgi:hypothetical protein
VFAQPAGFPARSPKGQALPAPIHDLAELGGLGGLGRRSVTATPANAGQFVGLMDN